jgi:uncharacterized membrane protein
MLSVIFIQIYICRSITKVGAIHDWILGAIIVIQLALCILAALRIVYVRTRSKTSRSTLVE